MPNLQPDMTGLAVRDNRPLPGPWSYELGTRIRVTQQSQLIALRFWKEPGETGTHVGRVWSSTGTQIASATFQGESASGWQRQALASPVTLQPGQTYVVSVGLNAFYAKTIGGLAHPAHERAAAVRRRRPERHLRERRGPVPDQQLGLQQLLRRRRGQAARRAAAHAAGELDAAALERHRRADELDRPRDVLARPRPRPR